MDPSTALVTGAGRGYGLELCRCLVARGVHGPIVCTRAALPRLRRSPLGTIVDVASRLGSIARVAAGAYDHLRISYAMRIG